MGSIFTYTSQGSDMVHMSTDINYNVVAFAAQKSSLATNFLQHSLRNLVKLRLNIRMKFVGETVLYPKVR